MRCCLVFFFHDTATTELYTLPLHGALPIWPDRKTLCPLAPIRPRGTLVPNLRSSQRKIRSIRREVKALAEESKLRGEHNSEESGLGIEACRTIWNVEGAMGFRVTTLNLEQDHKRWDERRELIVEELGGLKPDVFAINEICLPRQIGRAHV